MAAYKNLSWTARNNILDINRITLIWISDKCAVCEMDLRG
jgi:hypothetical protein